jgi:hypothetical protein
MTVGEDLMGAKCYRRSPFPISPCLAAFLIIETP